MEHAIGIDIIARHYPCRVDGQRRGALRIGSTSTGNIERCVVTVFVAHKAVIDERRILIKSGDDASRIDCHRQCLHSRDARDVEFGYCAIHATYEAVREIDVIRVGTCYCSYRVDAVGTCALPWQRGRAPGSALSEQGIK